MAICTAGDNEESDVEDATEAAAVVDISAHAELSGAIDDLYSHRVSTDFEPLVDPKCGLLTIKLNSQALYLPEDTVKRALPYDDGSNERCVKTEG